MSRLSRINLILVSAVLVLSGLAKLQPGIAVLEFPPLTELDHQEIMEINIFHGERRHLALLKDKQGWMMTHPVIERALPERVEKLLRIIRQPSLKRFPAANKPLSEYGLAPPKYQLQLDALHIYLGSIDPVSQLRYANTDDQIHLISDGHIHHLLARPHQYLQQSP